MTPLFCLHLFLVWFVDAVQTEACRLSDVGVNKTDHGPLITVQPEDAIYDPANAITHIVMNCKADASPMASYVWYVQQTEERRPVNLNDPNITVTAAGSLMIEKPSVTLHGGSYQCVASNCFGSVLSNEARLSFSYLNDFPRSLRNPVIVREFTGVGIECLPPRSGYDYTELLYSWFKDTLDVPVRSDVQWNTFSSQDGKLYFQFVTKDDAGTYYCVVRRPTNAMGDIPEGKVSQPIPLHVVETTPSDQGLVIIDRFPRSFPLTPKTGDDVRVECFAFGTSMSQMDYWWNRTDGKPISSNANFSDYSRVMTFQSIQLSDAGQYRCSVSRQDVLSTYGELQLTVEAEPYFTKPLQDMNVEENSTVSWLCIANGVPAITYDWYVNATLINETLMLPEDRERFRLVDNVLTITNAQRLDSGMYQCSASNVYGSRLSSAQLRVLDCSPNCNISFGCHDPNTCNTCNRGYGRTSNGTCDVCGDYCNTTGCVKNGARKCDGCDLGNELTSSNVCIPVINNSTKNVTNWTLLLLIIFSQFRHQHSIAD